MTLTAEISVSIEKELHKAEQDTMNFRVLSFILAVLLFACTDYTQDESSSKIAKSATSSAGENKAHTNAEAGESIRHIVPIKKELSTLRERIAKGHSMISYARKKGISIPEFACESFRKAAEDGVVTIRQHNYMGLPQEEKTTQNFMAIILQYREIEVMLDDSALSGFADAERAALLKELRAAGAELLTEAHNGALKAGNQREAEMICNSAMQIGISREVVDKLRQKSVTADFSSMEETFNSYLKNHDIDLRYGQLFLKHMKDAGASAKTLERNRKKLQEESDRRLLAAVRRNTKAGSYLGGTFTSVETPESVAKRMKLLPPGEKILPELKALLNEAATDHLVRTFRQIFNPDQNSPVAWKEVEEVLNKAQQSGVPAEVLERAERIVKNEVTYYVQRRLWGLLANTGIDYGKSGQSNFELTIKFIDYTARFGIEKEKLEEWRRQVYEMRDVRFQRKFEWLLHTAKFDKAEALLQ